MLMYYTFCFFIPKIILKKPLNSLGLLTKTTFIVLPPPSYLAQPTANMITHIASTAINSLGGRKQLAISPQAKAKAHEPLLNLHLFRTVFSLPTLQYIEKTQKCYLF